MQQQEVLDSAQRFAFAGAGDGPPERPSSNCFNDTVVDDQGSRRRTRPSSIRQADPEVVHVPGLPTRRSSDGSWPDPAYPLYYPPPSHLPGAALATGIVFCCPASRSIGVCYGAAAARDGLRGGASTSTRRGTTDTTGPTTSTVTVQRRPIGGLVGSAVVVRRHRPVGPVKAPARLRPASNAVGGQAISIRHGASIAEYRHWRQTSENRTRWRARGQRHDET